jgi:hypothetical protein
VEDVECSLGGQQEEFFVKGLVVRGNWNGSDFPFLEVSDDGNCGLRKGDWKGGGLGQFHGHIEGVFGHFVRWLVCCVKTLREWMTFLCFP